MSIERALLNRAYPHMLAEKARRAVHNEASKGCQPVIRTQPVALEPRYEPIRNIKDLLASDPVNDAVPEQPVSAEHLVRLRAWIPRDFSADWRRGERFLKQLVGVNHRIGFEIIGNEAHVGISILCHQQDLPVLYAAFYGEFPRCELTIEGQRTAWGQGESGTADTLIEDYYPAPPYSHLLSRPEELRTTPFETLLATLARVPSPAVATYQVLLQPVQPDNNWHRNVEVLQDLEYNVKMFDGAPMPQRALQAPSGDLRQMAWEVESKAHNDKPLFAAAVRIALCGADRRGSWILRSLATFMHLFQHGGRPLNTVTRDDFTAVLPARKINGMLACGVTYRPGFLVNSWELAGLVHLPPASVLDNRHIRLETLDTLPVPNEDLSTGTRIGTRAHAGHTIPVCIPDELRRRHVHVIGRPDTGKSMLLKRMILEDMERGDGVAVIDPHGDLIELLLDRISERDVDRTIYFDPGDREWVPLWNPLSLGPGQDPTRVAADLVSSFKSFVTGWGDRLERFLREAFYALLHLPGSTLLDVSTVLSRKSDEGQRLRDAILAVVDGEEPRKFWAHDFPEYRKDDLGPPKNKLSKLLVGGTVALMLSQPDSAFNFRKIMDDGMILLVNLSTVGPDVSGVLGCLILSLVHNAALSRSDTAIEKRRQFHSYCDEAPRFMTDALEEMIAETRKYRVSLTLAHQFLSQFNQRRADALSATGSTIIFNVDRKDAGHLTKDLRGLASADDLITLSKFEAILRAGTDVVRIDTPEFQPVTGKSHRDQIITESHRKYCRHVTQVRNMIRHRHANEGAAARVSYPTPDDPLEELVYDELQ
ncbi:MAG: ATP-binding protein [Phycisphaerae bacterium]|nr:ATP-binding protein [Phycisphaerae bacterium]